MRPQAAELSARLKEPRRFIQALTGPRQSGKTTLVRHVVETGHIPSVMVSADDPGLRGLPWIDEQWNRARALARGGRGKGAVLVLDEVHKITGWPEAVKRLWDEDTGSGLDLRVVLLGSAPLLVQRGLGESLAGRFELLRVPHWSYAEMKTAFGLDLDAYVLHGGYPGAAPLIGDPERWAGYIRDSLIETTLSRDVLLLTRVDKPALLRRLFELACLYSGQVLSYQKMLGQLTDAGNTTTLAHYLDLLDAAGMVTGLQKYAGQAVRRRGSSPKLQVLNTALLTAQSGLGPEELRRDGETWGRLVESAVGAHLANAAPISGFTLHYWREGNNEVDFVVRKGNRVTAIEVKSGRRSRGLPGMAAFLEAHGPARSLLVGGDGIPLEEFLSTPAPAWVAG